MYYEAEEGENRLRMLIYIVRHGETRSNVDGILQGWTNDPLNENGISLAEITGRGMKGIHFDECISSPLIRTRQTAEIILRESGNLRTPIEFDSRIMEISMGDWEGKRFRPGEREVDERDIKIFFTEPFQFRGFPGGENVQQVCARTQEFLRELARRDDGKTYLVTTHGFALRGMLNMLYDNPEDYWHGHVPYNCAVNILKVESGKIEFIEEDKVYYDLEEAVDQYSKF